MKAPDSVFISLAAKSRPTETIRLPSMPKRVPRTQFSWWLVFSNSLPEATSWIRTVLSEHPKATRDPSGERETPNRVS